jgi:hypothetical protein
VRIFKNTLVIILVKKKIVIRSYKEKKILLTDDTQLGCA